MVATNVSSEGPAGTQKSPQAVEAQTGQGGKPEQKPLAEPREMVGNSALLEIGLSRLTNAKIARNRINSFAGEAEDLIFNSRIRLPGRVLCTPLR